MSLTPAQQHDLTFLVDYYASTYFHPDFGLDPKDYGMLVVSDYAADAIPDADPADLRAAATARIVDRPKVLRFGPIQQAEVYDRYHQPLPVRQGGFRPFGSLAAAW